MCLTKLRVLIISFCLVIAACASAPPTPIKNVLPNGTRIEELTGLKGKADPTEGVFKVSYPRKDLKVESTGVSISPPLGLTAWAAFTSIGSHVMMMGDIVLTENQVNPVMDVALANGLEVTALHNHFLWEKPRIMFMHIGGAGPEDTIAKATGEVFKALQNTIEREPKAPTVSRKITPKESRLDGKRISEIVGTEGELNDGVYKITIGRTTQMHGHSMRKAMGVNTWAAFAGSEQEAVVDGDFAMLESELQGVIKALRQSGINIVSIHNHMTMENPRIMFLHFWGIGRAEQLAQGIRNALITQGH
jgi:hypothetical protein